MSTPLLTAKLRIPPAGPRHIPRPGLIDLLERGTAGKLTLLSAPAGFGKTALLGEWAMRAGRPVAWVTVDSADNDPDRFWAHVVAALTPLLPGLRPDATSVNATVTALSNAMMEPGQPLALVLDDYHQVSAPPVHTAVAYLLEHLPAWAHVVIAGRVDPPLPLARLRAHLQLTELRSGALAFTPEEAQRFVRQATEPAITSAQIERLHARTEGWAVGLQLAVSAMQGRTDPGRFLEGFSGSHRHVLDFVAQEVLRGLPVETQRFLLQTSVLHRLTGSLCDAVTGEAGGHARLAALERENVFLVPLDEERRWYRYHRLFAEALHRLLQLESPGLEPELHSRAARWYEAHGAVADTVDHAAPTEPLSEREVEILRLIHAGLSNQEIAGRLFLTVSTVKWHIHNIYGKLGVRSRTQAVAMARALAVLTPEDPT